MIENLIDIRKSLGKEDIEKLSEGRFTILMFKSIMS